MRFRRNKKKRLHGFVFPVPIAGILVVIAALGLTYVYLGCRCETLGQEIKSLEKEQAELGRKYVNAEFRWAKIKSPQSLEAALAARHIAMTWPRSDQVIWLAGRPISVRKPAALASRGVAKYARAQRTVHE